VTARKPIPAFATFTANSFELERVTLIGDVCPMPVGWNKHTVSRVADERPAVSRFWSGCRGADAVRTDNALPGASPIDTHEHR
jgi:hypothetical protein